MLKFSKFLLLFLFSALLNNYSFSQETIKKCRINSNKQILDFVKKELTPFKQGTNDEGPRLSNADLKQLEIMSKVIWQLYNENMISIEVANILLDTHYNRVNKQ